MKRSRSLIAALVAALLAVSSVALASDMDTIVSFGYDPDNHILAVNSGDTDTPYVCDFSDGALEATYSEIVEGFLTIESLMSGEDEWEFEPRDAELVSDEYEPAEDPSPYSDGECDLSALLLAGPNGQINHGQFLKAAKSLIDIKGHGCIVREFAKSDIGKTEDTKIRTSDVDPEFQAGTEGEIQFTTFTADCEKPNKKGEHGGSGGERGKSGDAPGHNKDS